MALRPSLLVRRAVCVLNLLLVPSAISKLAPFSGSFVHSFSRRFPAIRRFNAMAESKVDPVLDLGLPNPILLGSGSFTRKLILSEMGIQFEKIVMPIDEKGIGDRSDGSKASELVTLLAKAKADHIVNNIMNDSSIRSTLKGEEWIVLTGDQVVVQGNDILEKPENIDEAKRFVRSYGLSAPRTVGSCVLTHVPSLVQVSGVDTAQINFRSTITKDGDDLIKRLIEDSAPVMSCAGGLMVEHPFVREYIEGIDGTEDSVMGLSKDLVLRLLGELKEKLRK